ncbi:MAG TPA: 2-C-methyl-D-erythritol 4-phosphate cytidylyltransferase [Steroidobacteraceae bacterium]|jgi:2-C-methyl-D-erythritol 4-phosphate cytidylyltransferase
MRYWIVMPAAGAGRRFGSAKQYALLGGRTVLDTALQIFIDDPECHGGCVLLANDDPHRQQLARQLGQRFVLADGGRERAHSVYNGLTTLAARAKADDWVLVHDAVRPALSRSDLTRLLQQGAADPIGALLAVPVADTVKQLQPVAAEDRHRSGATLPRESLWLAQTPQMFRYAPLRAALEQAAAAGRAPTDESQAMEWRGHAPLLVQAHDANLKITTATDLALLAEILRRRAQP